MTAALSVIVVLLLGGVHPPSSWWQVSTVTMSRVPWKLTGHTAPPGAWLIAYWAGVALLAGSVIAAGLLADPRKPRPDGAHRGKVIWLVPALPLALLAVTAAIGPTAAWAPAGESAGQPNPLPGSDDVTGLLTIALAALMVLFGLILVLPWARPAPPADTPKAYRPFVRGWFAVPIAALGCFLGAGLGAGYAYIAAGCLKGSCSPHFVHARPASAPLVLPPFYGSISELWAVTAILAAAGLLLALAYFLVKARLVTWKPGFAASLEPGMTMQDAGEAGRKFSTALAWQLARWRLMAAGAVTAVSGVMAVAGVLSLEAQWLAAGTAKPSALKVLRPVLDLGFLASATRKLGLVSHYVLLGDIGVYVLAAATLALLLVVYNAARRPDSARSLGILWDLASYWPRAAHPFVPPCYAHKAVPELVRRSRQYIEDEYDVVLSAHSQGTLLVLSAALRMKMLYGNCDRLGLVMAGSQLQWAYPRAFPAVVNAAAYRRVLTDIHGRWYVLARGTDPLGGPVLSWKLRASGARLTAGHLTPRTESEHLGSDDQAGCEVSGPGPDGMWRAGHDLWIPDPMLPQSPGTGLKLPPVHLSAQRHSGYWSHPVWDAAVATAAESRPGPQVSHRCHPAPNLPAARTSQTAT
jgi:hypothetical protein